MDQVDAQGVTRVLDFDKVLSTDQSFICPQMTFTAGSTAAGVTTSEPAYGGSIRNGSAIYGGPLPAGTLVQSGGGTDSLVLTKAATSSETVSVYVFGPALQTDPDLMPHPGEDNHPLRGGYQRMASLVILNQ